MQIQDTPLCNNKYARRNEGLDFYRNMKIEFSNFLEKDEKRLVRNEKARRRNALKAVLKPLPEEIEDIRYCVLDYSNPKEADYIFINEFGRQIFFFLEDFLLLENKCPFLINIHFCLIFIFST